MKINLFGFKITNEEKHNVSFAPEETDDGATIISGGATGFNRYTYDTNMQTAMSEPELITKYRELSLQAEIQRAVDEIINEAIATDEVDIVTLNTDRLEGFSDKTKKILQEEFNKIIELYDFNRNAYEIFRRWYVDGQIKYHVIINEKNVSEGIKEIRYVDPRKLKKYRVVGDKKGEVGTVLQQTVDEFYVYNENGFDPKSKMTITISDKVSGVKIASDSVIYVTSGLTNEDNSKVLSYLFQAIKPFNNLKNTEDSAVIYRITKAVERKIFNIEVGGLQKNKAEEYMRELQAQHRSKLKYNAATGEVIDDRRHMTMNDDYWLAKRDGKGNTIDVLPAGQNLGEMGDVEYFKDKLYESLMVPKSRMNSEATFAFGRITELNRDELKFMKFIARLRLRFSDIFLQALRLNLILKGLIKPEEWAKIRNGIYVDFAVDSSITIAKELDNIETRLNILTTADQYKEEYFSKKWIRKNILRMTDQEWEEIEQQIEDEMDAEAEDVQNQREAALNDQGDNPSDNGVADAMPSGGNSSGTNYIQARKRKSSGSPYGSQATVQTGKGPSKVKIFKNEKTKEVPSNFVAAYKKSGWRVLK